MDVHVGSKDGPIPSLEAVTDQFGQDIRTKEIGWRETLAADPSRLAQVEQEIHLTFSRMADHTVAAVLAKASEQPEMARHQKKSWLQWLSRFAGRRSVR